MCFCFFVFLYLLLSCHKYFKKGGVFIGNCSVCISNEPANGNSHSVILSDDLIAHWMFYLMSAAHLVWHETSNEMPSHTFC